MEVRSCSYFNSNTFPLKLVLSSKEADGGQIKAIYKVGDDLRQDMLTLQVRRVIPIKSVMIFYLQMIRLMDRLWLRAGLDLRIVSFHCVPTGWKAGMVEFVEDAPTLREIQVLSPLTINRLTLLQTQSGVVGSFKPEVLYDWLAKQVRYYATFFVVL